MAAIPYPLINGFRHSGNSIEVDLGGSRFRGFKTIDYDRTRSRSTVWGNHPDPIGKTRGKNEYKASCELYLAEWHAWITSLGTGYGDKAFTVTVTYVEGGFDTITDILSGCTIDSVAGSHSSDSTDPLIRKFDLNPLKIIFGSAGLDDVAIPLIGST